MKEFWDKHLEFAIKTLVWVIGVSCTLVFWFGTMNNIPPRVERLEKDVSSLKEQLIKNDVKTDLILQDTNYIKQNLLKK